MRAHAISSWEHGQRVVVDWPARHVDSTHLLTVQINNGTVIDQRVKSHHGRFDVSGYLAENAFGFLPVPMVITEPAVDSGIGAFGLIFHESEEAAQKRKEMMLSDEGGASSLIPPNVSAIGGVVTGNRFQQ